MDFSDRPIQRGSLGKCLSKKDLFLNHSFDGVEEPCPELESIKTEAISSDRLHKTLQVKKCLAYQSGSISDSGSHSATQYLWASSSSPHLASRGGQMCYPL